MWKVRSSANRRLGKFADVRKDLQSIHLEQRLEIACPILGYGAYGRKCAGGKVPEYSEFPRCSFVALAIIDVADERPKAEGPTRIGIVLNN